MARSWKIHVPVRPKAIQSVRGGRNGFYADKKAVAWKKTIRPYIEAACDGKPTEYPLVINRLRYMFKAPQSASKTVMGLIRRGATVPYLGPCDITDNLAKGLIDTCAGLVFVNDKLIWRTCDIEKVYAEEDGIYIEFEETPDVLLIEGGRADGVKPDASFLL